MSAPKLTQWFDGSVRPMRDGVYQRGWRSGTAYALFRNGKWHCSYWVDGPKAAFLCDVVSGEQNAVRWRGLASNPKAKP